ncbi:histidine protein methyltransferase 1 homolog isoform X2 [Prunus avium]|uniref:protein-histidine N-methyltransferase n=1 Tax=Prunus avium TaxID=42229 RepID=A0A6P5SAX0_PRUAV|nr:histidine protein methyltransferase 1 homolog isoform X2 [Prunus avium]
MESQKPSFEPFRLFSSSGSGFLEQSEPPLPPLPPPPPCVEVLPSEILPSVKYTVEPVELGGLTLLKLGCGHGLPGIFACLEGAAAIHFQDFNAEVLQCLTIPNVNSNVPSFQRPALQVTKCDAGTEIRFFAGDWREIHKLLPYAQSIEKDLNVSTGKGLDAQYDIILMGETVYSISALPHLYELIKKAAKKHYFGVGGGTRRFLSIVEKDVADGSSNVQEVRKLSFTQAWNSCG